MMGKIPFNQIKHPFFILIDEGKLWLPIFLALVLVAFSFYDYLLFHTLIELFAVGVGTMMFTVAWNTYPHSRNNFLMFLASGYFWVAMMDLAHALLYKGMSMLPIAGANIATQFWIIPRYGEALLLLLAPLFLARTVSRLTLFLLFGTITLLFSVLIITGNFPDAYIENQGLTRFKITSEYLIILILVTALIHLYSKRRFLPQKMVMLLATAMVLTMGAELFFTFYVSVYGLSNLIGHLFKLFSYWMLFVAVVQYTLTEPYNSLKSSEKKYRTLLNNLPQIAIWQKDANSTYITCNENYVRDLGITPEQIVGKTDFDIRNRKLAEEFRQVDQEVMSSGKITERDDSYIHEGQEYFVHTKKIPLFNGEGECSGTLGITLDITERKKAESLERHAYYDPLTDLANRRFFEDLMERSLARARRHLHKGALLFLDLDNFKPINDNFGHAMGDELLRQVARRLEATVRKEDLVARLGGDEFVILLPEVADTVEAATSKVGGVAEKIRLALSQPYFINEHKLSSTASIGIAVFPVADESKEQLLKQADIAMYEAKSAGRNVFRIYQPE